MLGLLALCVFLLTLCVVGLGAVGYALWRIWRRESVGEVRFDRAPWRDREYWA